VAFGTTFRVTGGFRKAETNPVKRDTGRIFTKSDLTEAWRHFILDFLHKKTAKIVKTIVAYSKSTVLVFMTLKKNINLVIRYHFYAGGEHF
jgi:hypothetical protein